jgi:aldehyde:ferredoxin oxidoreductase
MIEDGASDLYMQRLAMLGFDKTLPPLSLGPDKVRFALKGQLFYSFLDSADLCQFVFGPAWTLYGPQETVDFVRAATGWEDFTLDELLAVGERRLNMLRVVNARQGLDRGADRLPDKFFQPLKGEGPTAGTAISRDEIETAKDAYYDLAGWDRTTGNPTRETLARLGLEWAA